jgi:hypothetical protein
MNLRGERDYLQKYGPLIQILSDPAELEEVSSEPGYTQAAGTRYKSVRLRALLGYIEELAADFEELKAALVDRAVVDAELAKTLRHTERTLLSLVRRVRVRIFLEQFFRAPKPSGHPGLLTRCCRHLVASQSPLSETLSVMSKLQATLAS